jgi:hypothetical protein
MVAGPHVRAESSSSAFSGTLPHIKKWRRWPSNEQGEERLIIMWSKCPSWTPVADYVYLLDGDGSR